MSGQALVLVLLAGLLHAGWNLVAKQSGGDARFAFFVSIWLLLVWSPLALWLGWRELPQWGAPAWLLILLSGSLHVLYFLTLLRGYRVADLTVVYPLARGSAPLLSALAAVLLLGERPGGLALAGVLGVVAGVLLIAGGSQWLRRHPAQPVQRRRQRQRLGLMYGLLTGLCIASYTVVDGYGVKVLLISPVLVDYMGNMVRLCWLAPAALRDRQQTRALWRQQWRAALLVAVFSPVAYVLVLFAMQTAPLSHVAPAREVSMLFAALIGGRLLGEGDRLWRVAGALLIGLGVAGLAAG